MKLNVINAYCSECKNTLIVQLYNLCNVTSSSQTNQSQEGVGIMTSAFLKKMVEELCL